MHCKVFLGFLNKKQSGCICQGVMQHAVTITFPSANARQAFHHETGQGTKITSYNLGGIQSLDRTGGLGC